jgi:hypothetical protein
MMEKPNIETYNTGLESPQITVNELTIAEIAESYEGMIDALISMYEHLTALEETNLVSEDEIQEVKNALKKAGVKL